MSDIDVLARHFSAAEIGRRIGASRHQVASWIQHTRPVPQKYHAALHELAVRLGPGTPPLIEAHPSPGGGFAVDDARDRAFERLIYGAGREYRRKLQLFGGDSFIARQALIEAAREVFFKTGTRVDPRRIAGMSQTEIDRRDAFAEYQRRAAVERAAEVEAAGGWIRWLFGLGPPRSRPALPGPDKRKQTPGVDPGQAALAEAAAEIAAAYYGAPTPAPQGRPAAAQARAGTPCIYCGQRAVIFLWDGPRCGAHVMS